VEGTFISSAVVGVLQRLLKFLSKSKSRTSSGLEGKNLKEMMVNE
jgi:hypothetical protein